MRTKQLDEAWWERARHGRDLLAAQLHDHPDVTLIDIGLDPLRASETPVLRVHLRRGDGSDLKLAEAIDAIPIRFMHGDYRLQRDAPVSGEKEVDQ